MTAPSQTLSDRSGESISFAATLVAYQMAQTRLRALQQRRAATAALPDMLRPQTTSGGATLRTIREDRVAREQLRAALGHMMAASVRAGRSKSDFIERMTDELRQLVHSRILVSDALLTDQVVAWIVEDYPVPAVAPVRSRPPIRRGVLSIESARSERVG